ncbi:MAG: hypothetical protein PHX30_04600 [Candidatus Pacebacteria bacterium]|nr:hypothetical protein [Candidatus Paceibacterota bacterium]
MTQEPELVGTNQEQDKKEAETASGPVDGTNAYKKDDEIKSYLEKKKDDDGGGEDFSAEPKKSRKKMFVIIGAVVVLVLAVVAYLSYNKGQESFENGKVTVFVEAESEIESGAEVSLTIGYKNDNPVNLKDVRMEIFFPDNFIVSSSDKAIEKEGNVSFWRINKIAKNSTDKIRVFGKFIGNEGDVGNVKGVLKYKPSNFNSEFQAESQVPLAISSVPVDFVAKFPEGGVKNDVDTDIAFSLKNKSIRNFTFAKVDMQFPESFTFVSSDVVAVEKDEKNNKFTFEFSDFTTTKEMAVVVKGNFHSENDKESIKADIYLKEGEGDWIKYLEKSEETAVTRPGISIVQTINGAEDYVSGKNEDLEYKIEFENQSAGELRGLTLRNVLTGNYNLSTLKADKGTVKNNEIVWSAAKVPALAQLKPGEKGSVSFKVKVSDLFTIEKENDKNFILENKVTVNTADQEIINLTKSSKVRAFLYLETKGYFNDDGRIANGGAIPPKVGEKTYYTIHWSVRNLFNEVENIRIKSVLPKGVKWTGKYIDSKGKVVTGDEGVNVSLEAESETNTEIQVEDDSSDNTVQEINNINEERIYYDIDSNMVVWEIPKFKANDGILTSAKEIVFQIEVEPQVENVGKAMDIIDNITATGYDTFVQQNITNSGKKVSTELFDDYSISTEEAIVQGA